MRWSTTAWVAGGLALGLGTMSCTAHIGEGSGQANGAMQDGPASGGTGGNEGDLESTGQHLEPRAALLRCETSQVGPRLLRRLTRDELQATIEDVFPQLTATWQGVTLSPAQASGLGFNNDAAYLTVAFQTAKELLDTAEDVADLVVSDSALPAVLPCSAAADRNCATTFVEQVGFRLFRRPITAEEQTQYVGLYDSVSSESDFKTGLKWTLVSLLQSPHTVYRREIGTPVAEGYELTPYEIATELAYTFGGTAPDATLLERAQNGELSDPEVRTQIARELLQTPRGRAIVVDFFRQWLKYGTVRAAARDDVPNFAEIAPQLIEETDRFVEQVVFADGGDVHQVFTADYTMLNANLSSYYGYGAVAGDWQVVPRPPEWGTGVLAQGSVLASTAHEAESSPTLRGLLVYHRVLCNNELLPPPNVPSLESAVGTANTTRERYEDLHASQAFCAACHNEFDPAGFTFEHFDETGRYRADENGYAIDPSGNIKLADGSRQPVANLQDLAQQVMSQPQIVDCFSGLLASYAFAGGGGTACLAEAERTELQSRNIGIAEYLARLSAAPHFTRRH